MSEASAPTLSRAWPSRVCGTARRYPLTAVVAALVVVTSATGVLLRAAGREGPAASERFPSAEVMRPLAALGVTSSVLAFLTTLAAVIVLLGAAERLMGWRRSLVAFLVTTLVGTGVGGLASLLDADGRPPLELVLGHATSFDPWTAIVGTIVTASAFAGALWRRRIRAIAVTVVAALLLYAGHSVDLYAAVALVAGLALGALLRRRPVRTGWRRSSHHEVRVLLATVVIVSAIGPVIALASRARTGLLAPLAAVIGGRAVSSAPHCSVGGVTDTCVHGLAAFHLHGPFALLLAVAPLVALAVGGVGLLRGSRFALWLVVGIDVVTGIAAGTYYGLVPHRVSTEVTAPLAADHLAVSLSIAASVLVPLVTAVVLVACRANFPVRTSRRRVLAFVVTVGATVVLLAVTAVIVVAAAGLEVRDPLRLALLVLGPVAPVTLPPHATHVDELLRAVIGTTGPVLWAVIAIAALRPTGVVATVDDDQAGGAGGRARARALLIAGGGDTFGWMTTWAANAYWFDADGRAAIAYRRSGRVAVTVGGPFGWEDARSEALEGFARFCDDNGWTPVFYGVEAQLGTRLQRLGWSTLPVAEDADLDPRTWTTSGKRKQDVRTSVNKANREGVRAVWSAWQDLTPTVVRQIEAISEEWVADRELPEMGFTLGGVDEMRDPAVRTLVALTADDRVLAVTSWLPSFRDGQVVGWTLDVMRRRSDAPNGVMEFLVASAAQRMRDDGAERMSLSAAPLASSAHPQPDDATQPQASGVESVLDLVGGMLEPVYGFRSLLRFKAKFGPDLHPLVMAFPDPVALPAIGTAIVRTYLPGLSFRQAVRIVRGRGGAGA